MNIHSPQNEEALSEAMQLLDISKNIISSKNNTNLVGTVADAVTGVYLLSKSEITKEEADQLLFASEIVSDSKKKTLTGSEVFAQILPKATKIKVPSIIDSENSFGTEDGVMVKAIDREFGRDVTMDSINKAFTLGVKYLARTGYSLALHDLGVSDKIKEMSKAIIDEAEKKTNQIILDFESGKMEAMPGKTAEETRETRIMQILNEVRTDTGDLVKTHFPADSEINKMIKSGSKGSLLNVAQMGCCVGQQSLWDSRINFGYNNRTLPFFKEHDLTPESRGFIKSSFFEGLKPSEFFFGAMTGRDALMDTALRTPKSGYLYRRLVSALQDLKVEYDGTVRDASDNVVQFMYGNDGKDVSKLHLKEDRVDPGEAVGVITAQSFGEASTQMVLRTFHMAGVAEMQVTLGLPRLIEILDARKQPSTPLMNVYLDKEHNNEKDARVIAEKIKEVKLQEVLSTVNMDFVNKEIVVELDAKSLKQVHIGPSKVLDRIIDKKYNAGLNGNKITVSFGDLGFKELYKAKEKLKVVIIAGIKGIPQVVVTKKGKDYVVLTSGSNLGDLMEVKGIDKKRITSNDLHDVNAVLGVEAARQTIINEIRTVIESQALDINERHLFLIADAMTTTGIVKGVTRMGIITEKASILARATFETPDKQFVNATMKGNKDELRSVIENILLNQPVPVGTGLPGLLVKVTGPLSKNIKSEKKAKK